MSPSHQLPPDAYERRCAEIKAMKRDEYPVRAIMERFGLSRTSVNAVLKTARDRGEELPPAREPSTRESRTGRLSGGIGRSHDLGWDRCGGTGGGR